MATQPDVCVWTYDDDLDGWGIWETTCGQSTVFENGGPSENLYRFCPYCGKPLVESDKVEDTDATD